jgi:hypothetical protein
MGHGMPLSGSAIARAMLLAAVLVGLACSPTGPLAGITPRNKPIVAQQTFSAIEGSLKVVAVMPFYPKPELRQRVGSAEDAEEIAQIVSNFYSEALTGNGVRVIPPSDTALAFTNRGRAVPWRDPRGAADILSEDFGVTSIVVGSVYRWRERGGAAYGSDSPAGVGFELSLFDTRDGRRLFNARFDHTQRTLSGDPFMAAKYPGGGSRFLTVAELARWGAGNAATAMVDGQWRLSN